LGDEIARALPPFPQRDGFVFNVDDDTVNQERIAELLAMLRQRTAREITIAVMSLAGCFTPEMWRPRIAGC
jgi:hypothetical protein